MIKNIREAGTICSSFVLSNSCLELTCKGDNGGNTFTLGLILLPCSEGVRFTIDVEGKWEVKFNYTFLQSQSVKTSITTCSKKTSLDVVVVLDHLNQGMIGLKVNYNFSIPYLYYSLTFICLQVNGNTQELCYGLQLDIVFIRYIEIPLDCKGGRHKFTSKFYNSDVVMPVWVCEHRVHILQVFTT